MLRAAAGVEGETRLANRRGCRLLLLVPHRALPEAVAHRLDVGALAALYTGWASTAMLARAGRLSGGGEAERAALDAAFAGPAPWMADSF